LSQTRIRRAGP